MRREEYKPKHGSIALYFGMPTGGDITDDINIWAVNHEISYETASIECFKALTTKILNRRDEGRASYFDLLMCECFHRNVLTPEVDFAIHGVGIKLPVLVIKDTAVIHEPSNHRLALTSQVLDQFGTTFSNEFDFEYLGYERSESKSKKSESKHTYFLNKYDVTYTLNSAPHYFDGERFIKI